MLTDREYTRLKKQLWAEYQKKLGALNILAGKDEDQPAEPAPQPPQPSQPQVLIDDDLLRELESGVRDDVANNNTPAPATLSEAVKNVVDKFHGDFTMKDVYHTLLAAYPGIERPHIKPTISHYLKRFVVRDHLRIVHRGAGKALTVYRHA